jgi:pimeloyl-ACP methyl ester carboxylesterase
MPFCERGQVRVHYEDVGSGFPLLVIPGGGLNSTIAGLATHPFNPFDEFKGEFRVIAADLRNAKGGQSSGPLEADRPWDAYTDDHIGLMDHLGIREFMVLGFCIGGPFIWNLLKRAGDRVVAAVPAQPSGYRPEMPGLSYNNNMKGWGPTCVALDQKAQCAWLFASDGLLRFFPSVFACTIKRRSTAAHGRSASAPIQQPFYILT